MADVFVYRIDANVGLIQSANFTTKDGTQWSLEGKKGNNYEYVLKQQNHLGILYYVELVAIRLDSQLDDLNGYRGSFGTSIPAQYPLVNYERKWCKLEKSSDADLVFQIPSSEYLIKNVYPDVLKVVVIPVRDAKQKSTVASPVTNIDVTKYDTLSGSMAKLFDSGILSDVVLTTETCSIKAHKVILSARSPVFEKSFKEESDNKMNIPDVSDDTLKAMLLFIYTGKITFENMGMTQDLYIAAHKYKVEDLKEVCSEWLKCTSVDSAVDTLLLADHHNDQKLKSSTMAFICQNYSAIKDLKKWKTLLTARQSLAIEFLSYKIKQLEG